MIRILDSDQIGKSGYIGLEVPDLNRDEVKLLMGTELRARKNADGIWVLRKDRYRSLWRFLQRRFPDQRVAGPAGTFVVDPTLGTLNSMGLKVERPAWMTRGC